MPNKSPTESGKIQTAVLGKEAAHPSFGDRVWTSPYIFFKYPHIPVCTDAPARVRQYAFSMATVLVFDGEVLPTPFVGRGRVFATTPTLRRPHQFRMSGVPDRGIFDARILGGGGPRKRDRETVKRTHGRPSSNRDRIGRIC